MLSFVLLLDNGEARALDTVLDAVLDCDVGVPADSLTVTCPYDSTIRAHADKLAAYDGKELVFMGQLDNIVAVKRGMGVVLQLNARGPAAALLDNEAEPQTYRNPTAGLMARKHLAPFGLQPVDADALPYSGKLLIDKGTSHWQALCRFCLMRYGSVPRVEADGRVYLRGFHPEEQAAFSDGNQGTPYYWLKESQRRHCLLSEVKLKFRLKNDHHASLKNRNPAARHIRRVRYVNAAADNASMNTAEKMMENSNRDSYALTLRCLGCHAALLGKKATVRDSVLGEISALTVAKVRVTAGRQGEISEITLKKERFDVADELHNE